MKKYSNNKNVLMLLSLMKQHNIRKVIASPGTTNIAVVGSMQHDDYFEMYSCVDERSAAYMACGMSAESGEPVTIICTEATASRNYLPALTEAYYRKLPILVIAGSHGDQNIGHLHSQVIDRTRTPKDTVIYSTFINPVTDKSSGWYNRVEINKSIIKLRQHGGGPVLINLVASAKEPFGTDELPKTSAITLHSYVDDLPEMPNGRTAIFIGSHKQMSQSLLDEHVMEVDLKTCNFLSDDLVRVTGGPFEGITGRVARIARQKCVVIHLQGLQTGISTAYIPPHFLEKVEASQGRDNNVKKL